MPQSSERVRLSYIKEVTLGTTPAGDMTEMRITTENLSGTPQTKESAEIRADAQPTGQRIVGLDVGKDINAELCPSTCHQDFIAAAMRGAWGGTKSSVASALVIDATLKTITQASGSFVTDGFSVGDMVVLSGFANAENNTVVRLTAVGALELTYVGPGDMTDETGSGDEVVTRPDYIDWGTTDASFTIAKDFLDLTDKSLTYRGMRVGGLSLDLKYGDIATVAFTMAGTDYEVPATPLTDARTINSGGTEDSLNATADLGLILVDNVQASYSIESLSVKLDNGIIPVNSLGYLAPRDQKPTGLKVDISMDIYLEDANFDFHAKKLAQTPVAIAYFVRDSNGKGYAIDLPAVQLTFDDAAGSGRGALTKLSPAGMAKKDATLGRTIRIYKLV
ncbi:MAG: phage tail tube protein [Porticoccaceae bacterium]|nr:phage tail tube protein [Porticoccaceae bacterium]